MQRLLHRTLRLRYSPIGEKFKMAERRIMFQETQKLLDVAHHCSVLVFPLQKFFPLCWKFRNFLLRNIALVYFTLLSETNFHQQDDMFKKWERSPLCGQQWGHLSEISRVKASVLAGGYIHRTLSRTDMWPRISGNKMSFGRTPTYWPFKRVSPQIVVHVRRKTDWGG